MTKDPTINTSFLPDREREREIEEKKEKLAQEWLEQQENIKNQVNYSIIFIIFMYNFDY